MYIRIYTVLFNYQLGYPALPKIKIDPLNFKCFNQAINIHQLKFEANRSKVMIGHAHKQTNRDYYFIYIDIICNETLKTVEQEDDFLVPCYVCKQCIKHETKKLCSGHRPISLNKYMVKLIDLLQHQTHILSFIDINSKLHSFMSPTIYYIFLKNLSNHSLGCLER